MQRPPHFCPTFFFIPVLAVCLGMAPAAWAEEQRSTVFERFLSLRGGQTYSALHHEVKSDEKEQNPSGDDARDAYSNDGKPFDSPSCGLEERFFVDAADGRLDDFAPFDTALIAGGTEKQTDMDRYQQKAAMLVLELRQSIQPADAPRRQIESMFDFLHRRILHGGYDLAYTDVRRVLDDGRFNCVSATVLFNYFAQEMGFECRGLEMPGHAMSRLSLADGTLDVENTCPRWFQLNGNPEEEKNILSRTIGVQGSIDRSKAREVTSIELAAMIYYNRGVDLLGEKHFAEADRVYAKALRLDPHNATARGNLLATMNNWSIELGNEGRYAEAVDLLRRGLAMDPKFSAFAQNYVHVHHQWVEHLCEQGHFDEALKILDRAASEMPERDYLRKAQAEVRQRWAKSAGNDVATP